MKDCTLAAIFGIALGTSVTFCIFGTIYIERGMEANANKRFEDAYQEGVLAGKNKIGDIFNPYDSDTHHRTEWRRGYNKGLIESKSK